MLAEANDAISVPMALAGRVVTMDAKHRVLDTGVVYARDGRIIDVRQASAAAPAGFEDIRPVQTGGTIFPGMIELHNHLPYGVLQLWQVPKKYGNRDQWSGSSTPDYHRLISGPMGVLGRNEDVVPAVVRYVELRCLLGGTTTSQGVALASNAGIVKHYRGLVRNVESTGDPDLPPAATHIADIAATDAEHFLARISGKQKIILHLAEGTDESARRHFLALQYAQDKWAITPNLIGIHCVALKPDDFAILAAHGGSMVWSPLSNLLLYGGTADLGAALSHGVPVALGSDWAPSGSKNLLGELKVARLAAHALGVALSARDLVAMVTTTPANMLGWDKQVGSLEAGKLADLIVVSNTDDKPYDTLLNATESDLSLVMVNGVPRSGTKKLMTKLGVRGGQPITVGGHQQVLNLAEISADPAVQAVSAAEAITRLEKALADLGNAALVFEAIADPTRADLPSPGHSWLAVEGVIDNHMSSRPHLAYLGQFTGPNFRGNSLPARAAAAKAPDPLQALTLDPLTAVDNGGFYDTLGNERNLPPDVRDALSALKPH
jgi:5-methylthioadenosine/S-adenosylhomocysteine deaminase